MWNVEMRYLRNVYHWRIQGEKAKKWKPPQLYLLPLHQEKQINQMSRTLYSPRGTGQASFLSASKIFFACGLGGKTFGNGRNGQREIRPIRFCFCSGKSNQNPRHKRKTPATFRRLFRAGY
ncbi:MAG: hypothetical protein M1275_00185 [Patescibacteria group bacterium]|nr:hypothetical protein [Patescibacteria group bacterium]